MRPPLLDRFCAFILERHPFAGGALRSAIAELKAQFGEAPTGDVLESMRPVIREGLERALASGAPCGLPETTPRVTADHRWGQAVTEVVASADSFLEREAIAASLTPDQRREILRGMILTRATDNRLKALFTGSQIRYQQGSFQGKGYRSLGQEAIYAAGIGLRRGPSFRGEDGAWLGDVVAPMIRDLGIALAMRPHGDTVRMVLNAQSGKAGPPMDGRDFHLGDLSWGILPATAPLGIPTLTVAGLALAFERGHTGQVAISFIGEGGTSLGEWHEAINFCAARRLPSVFCVQNNQTALSTPVRQQSAARVFADKASGYGIPGITLDGTDPEAIAAAFSWAAERARAGHGPALIELVSMRICGHAHHDDMLYVGKDTPPGWTYPPFQGGYADPEAYAFWSKRDPIATYAARLEREEVIGPGDLQTFIREAEILVEAEERRVIDAPWPDAARVGIGVFAGEAPRERHDPLDGSRSAPVDPTLPPLDPGPPFESAGSTFLEGVMRGVQDALRADSSVFVCGEDVGGKYGNAFLLLRPLLAEFGDRLINMPIAEGAVLGACVGAALAGQRPIGEMQFNDFVACGFNQLVNNAAKIRYRWGGSAPMVVRMPWGGLRHAGPYHSQNTEAWFYRVPGLKIVVPSTPHDARALMASAVADPDPVLYYEHIGLYRDPRIRQRLGEEPPEPIPLGRAALRRSGSHLAIISYGAYVHIAMRAAANLALEGIECAVLDLRSLAPLDWFAIMAVTRHCGKVLIVHEDTRTGGIGESLAAVIQEEAFEHLDAPVRILGALDTPIPYAPPLEAAFLPGQGEIERAARVLHAY
ncbi:MAG: hypothetical protein JJE39_00010 [Vicinamibacteria bacterium]|nr:hypothetical protein [Vicinamibacteria bacterium]